MKISISFLGGANEIGMNMYIYETENSALIIDCGVKFATADNPGIDLIVPDFQYLETIKEKLSGIILSHAHEDHIGAVPFLLKKYPIKIYSNKFTFEVLEKKLDEHQINYEYHIVRPLTSLLIDDFLIKLIPVSHSLYGTSAIYLKLSDGFSALHISDYKIDFSPPTGEPFNIKPFIKISESGLSCLLADSTNSTRMEFTKSETNTVENINQIFKNTEGRIFFTTFASNIERLQTFFNIAKKYNRKVAVEGSSLIKFIKLARRNNYLKVDNDIVVPRKYIEKLKDSQIAILATGSQGELSSVITRIAKDDYGNIHIRKSDTFIFSSKIITGNEKDLNTTINNISKLGAICIIAEESNIHVSGHASAEDQFLLLKILKPDYLIPIHGEYIHLLAHKRIAQKAGINEECIIIASNGEKIIFNDGILHNIESIPTGKLFFDIKDKVLITSEKLRERKKIAIEGSVFIYLNVNLEKGSLNSPPVYASVGFELDENEKKYFINQILEIIDKEVFERHSKKGWEEFIYLYIKRYFKKNFKRKPVFSINIGVS